MLNEHTLTQLRSLRLDGMMRAVEEQATSGVLGFQRRPAPGAPWLLDLPLRYHPQHPAPCLDKSTAQHVVFVYTL
jgi:hypothetical protein